MKCFVAIGLLILFFLPTSLSFARQFEAGESRVDDKGIEQVYVPPGCFLMGASEEQIEALLAQNPPSWLTGELPLEQPQHEVCLTKGYWIDKYEVTNAAWQAFVDDGGYTTQDYWSEDGWAWLDDQNVRRLPKRCDRTNTQTEAHPRACITWYEAEAYANWRGGRLPTEAEWEFAARSPESWIYPWGNEWDAALANVVESESAMPVGSFPDGASWVGALDMAGNVMEWTNDWLAPYDPSVKDDPTGAAEGQFKVERGGWWGSNEWVARTTFRYFEDPPTYQDHHIGVRIVTEE